MSRSTRKGQTVDRKKHKNGYIHCIQQRSWRSDKDRRPHIIKFTLIYSLLFPLQPFPNDPLHLLSLVFRQSLHGFSVRQVLVQQLRSLIMHTLLTELSFLELQLHGIALTFSFTHLSPFSFAKLDKKQIEMIITWWHAMKFQDIGLSTVL